MTDSRTLTIREVAARTGIAAPTLRMWETRHGFPVPTRLPSGHRRYSAADVDRIQRVALERDSGLALAVAIGRARPEEELPEQSIFAGMRRRRPQLAPHLLPKRSLLGLSHAIEDECCARAARPLLVGSFQRESYYRASEPRWRDLARTAELALVFADFATRRDPAGGPVEVPIPSVALLRREWSLVCAARDYSACLAAWERPGQDDVEDMERRFECVWTVDPEPVRDAARIAGGMATMAAPDLAARIDAALDAVPATGADQLELAAALTNRMVAYVGSGPGGRH